MTREQIYHQHEDLAVKAARSLWWDIPRIRKLGRLEDVEQQARLVLIEAIDRYWTRSDFRPYCWGILRNSLLQAAADASLVRVPPSVAYEADALGSGKIKKSRYSDETIRKARARVKHGDMARVRDKRCDSQAIQEAMESLTNEDRKLLRAVFWEDRSTADLAEEYGVSQRTVERWISRAKDSFRVALEGVWETIRVGKLGKGNPEQKVPCQSYYKVARNNPLISFGS